MAKKLQVVIASAEATPFVKTGGLGDVAGSLPRALVQAGADVIVMVPKYGSISSEYTSRMEHLCDFYVSLGWRNEYCGLERLEMNGVTFLFIDNERYFKRDYPYGFFDDGERFAFFSKAVTESLQHLPKGFTCDVLHCNDWHTALAPVFLREFYQGLPLYERVRTVFSIHNIAFQGQFSDTILNDILGMAHIPNAARQLRCDERSINYMQGALDYADAITTVSPSYAWEIQTPEFGEGLDGILRRRSNVLSGIVNGIDTDAWNPATDPMIAANFSANNMAGKAECKRALQQELGLEVRDDRPLMVMVTRLTRQKGMDLVTYALDRILSGGVQVAILGTGDYEEPVRYFAGKYPGTMAARITFDNALSHRMYAGADLFLMPSLFEPCGLSQMIAMRYGTLPVVRETGGLRDTVVPYNKFTGEGTGFSFSHFNGDEMGDAVFRGARLFWDDRGAWDHLVQNAMRSDFSWVRSAQEYIDLYHRLKPDTEIVPFVPADDAVPVEPAEEPVAATEDPEAAEAAEASEAAEPAGAAGAAEEVATPISAMETEPEPAAADTEGAEVVPEVQAEPVNDTKPPAADEPAERTTKKAEAEPVTDAPKAEDQADAPEKAAKKPKAAPAAKPVFKTSTASTRSTRTAKATKATKATTAKKAAAPSAAVSTAKAATTTEASKSAAEDKSASETKPASTAKKAATTTTAKKATTRKTTAKASTTKSATTTAKSPTTKKATAAAKTSTAKKATSSAKAATIAADKPADTPAAEKEPATAATKSTATAKKSTSTTKRTTRSAAAKSTTAKTTTTKTATSKSTKTTATTATKADVKPAEASTEAKATTKATTTEKKPTAGKATDKATDKTADTAAPKAKTVSAARKTTRKR